LKIKKFSILFHSKIITGNSPKVIGGAYWTKFETTSSKIQMIKTTKKDSAGRNIWSGIRIRPASADFPPARKGLGGNAGGIPIPFGKIRVGLETKSNLCILNNFL